jgi:hypothetical protein
MLNVGRQQAANFGADLLEEDVLNILPDGQHFKIISESGRGKGIFGPGCQLLCGMRCQFF